LKCAAAKGAVAAPATNEDAATAKAGAIQRGSFGIRRIAWNAATSATVAANDIWNPGSASVSGLSAITSSAAIATERSEIARRSKRSAANITATMI
jgi:hypothetical protein